MGRGALAKVRWKNDRIRKKKARDKRARDLGPAEAQAGQAGQAAEPAGAGGSAE